MSRIIDRYVVREIARTSLGVTFVLLAILVGNQFARVLGRAASERLPRDAVFELMGLTTIEYLTLLLPLAVYFSIVLALGRLYRDSEMTAMAACGVGPARMYRPVLLFAALLSAAITWVAFELGPQVAYRAHVLKVEAQRALQANLIAPNRFRSSPEGDLVFYARGAAPDGALQDVFIQRRSGDRIELAVAARGVQRPTADGQGREIVLYDGRRFMGVPGTTEFRILEFREHGIPVILPPLDTRPDDKEMLSTLDLLESGTADDWAELHWRLSAPVSLLVLAVVAVPLARSGTRASRFDRLGYAVLVYLIYSNLLGVARSMLASERVPWWLGLWWVHLPLAFFALLLLAWQSGWRPFARRGREAAAA